MLPFFEFYAFINRLHHLFGGVKIAKLIAKNARNLLLSGAGSSWKLMKGQGLEDSSTKWQLMTL
jgi:hypothetical protein